MSFLAPVGSSSPLRGRQAEKLASDLAKVSGIAKKDVPVAVFRLSNWAFASGKHSEPSGRMGEPR